MDADGRYQMSSRLSRACEAESVLNVINRTSTDAKDKSEREREVEHHPYRRKTPTS